MKLHLFLLLIAAAVPVFVAAPADAATFNIADGDVAGLRTAMTTANNNGENDVINLAANGLYVPTNGDVSDVNSAFPPITSDNSHTLTINGNGATLQRSTDAGIPDFRLLFVFGGNATFDRLIVTNGHFATGSGAGIANTAGTLTLTNCVITENAIDNGNESAGASGGGIFNSGVLTVTDSSVSNNTASAVQSGRGGGISSNNTGTVTIVRSTISGNTVASASTGSGGGINTRGVCTIINSTISGNSATGPGNGGGIYHQPLSGGATLLLVNDTIANNGTDATGEGGGIYTLSSIGNGTLSVRNTIIATNTSNSAPDVFASAIDSQGHNFVGKTDGSSGWNATDLTGTVAMPRDPMLAALGNNGGVGFTHALLNTSLAIDAADDAVLDPPLSLTTDQRLNPRRIGAHVDIGAFEYDPPQTGPAWIVNMLDEHDDGICGTADCTLVEALNLSNADIDANTITFVPGLTGVIQNTAAPAGLVISGPVTIEGPGARFLTISGEGLGRLFAVTIETGPITISGLTLANGYAGAGSGGGAITAFAPNTNPYSLTLNNCRFDNNFAVSSGGAIYSGGPVVLNNCTFTTNVADGGFGGATHAFGDSFQRGGVTATNCTFYNNRAVGGGAVSNKASGRTTTTTMRNCTVSGNIASLNGTNTGGGVINQGTASFSRIRLENTIVAANNADDGAPDISGAIVSLGYNLVGDGTGSSGLTNGVNNDQVGNGGSPINPQLGPLQNNGGPTDTRALLANSPAINNGNDLTAPARDQRYYVRSGVSDKGAFEFSGTLAPLLAGSRKTHGAAGTFDVDLPLSGASGIECRSGGAGGNHQVVASFATPITLTSASITSGTGSVSNSSASGSQVIVDLTGVANAQQLMLTLSGVSDGVNMNNVNIPMRLLLADTTGNATVNASDVSQTKSRIGQAVVAGNFRSDINLSGTINATDVSQVKAKLGSALP